MRSERSSFHAFDTPLQYISAARAYPVLSAELEQELCQHWHEQRDAAAAQQLIGSHLRLVVKIARGYRGYGLPMEDLVGEGQLGLMRALPRFDPARGVRFATYAIWWIRSEIQAYVLRNWSLVRIGSTGSQKKLFFNLRKTRRDLQIVSDGRLKPEHVASIAEILDVPKKEVARMDQRLASPDLSLNAPINDHEQDDWQSRLADDGDGQEKTLLASEEAERRTLLLRSALTKLTPREHHIVANRYLTEMPMTVADLSQHHGLSKNRVRQIERQAVAKLKKCIRSSSLAAAISTPARMVQH